MINFSRPLQPFGCNFFAQFRRNVPSTRVCLQPKLKGKRFTYFRIGCSLSSNQTSTYKLSFCQKACSPKIHPLSLPPPPPPAQFFGLDPKKARPTILPPNISFLSPPVLWIRTKTSHCFSPLNRCVTLILSCSSSFFFNSAVLSVQFRHDRSSGMDVLATV